MTVPLVSIILPTFNGARYLVEAVESCRRQTLSNWELIIVDDASTDETPDIISRLIQEDNRIRTVKHEANRMLPAALNSGFSCALGQYLTWTSDDNRYKPSALERMWGFLENHPGVDIVYSDYLVIDDSGSILREVKVENPSGIVIGNVVGPSFMYRREVHLEIGGYDASLFLAEDFDFWLRAACKFKLFPLHESLYEYRIHAGSLTAMKMPEIHIAHRISLERSLPKLGCISPRQRAIGWCNLAAFAWSEGHMCDGFSHMLKAAASSFLVTFLVLGKVLLCGRRVTYSAPLCLPSWLERQNK